MNALKNNKVMIKKDYKKLTETKFYKKGRQKKVE